MNKAKQFAKACLDAKSFSERIKIANTSKFETWASVTEKGDMQFGAAVFVEEEALKLAKWIMEVFEDEE